MMSCIDEFSVPHYSFPRSQIIIYNAARYAAAMKAKKLKDAKIKPRMIA